MTNDLQYNFMATAIKILTKYEFTDVVNNLLKAQEDYCDKNYQKTISNSLLAINNTMRYICVSKKWIVTLNSGTKLINVICNSKLIPGYLQTQYTSLSNILKIDITSLRRNKELKSSSEIPEYFAMFALQSTIINIIFLMNAFEDSNKYDTVSN
ncbi:DUF7014 domain-containing protein [Pectinatus frisingensis]|uniref:DUF7014 domain-containing protein n=1 Tax=Pectinatus frisingensis TaxID=865 RepID=UPI0018C589BB|nr:hypothetical protein [Pectinatus frisingensis]